MMMSGALQDLPDFQITRGSSTQPMASAMEVLNINAPDRHTRFLGSMVHKDKAFRLPATIRTFTNSFVDVEKNFVQADQGSDINVISADCVKFFGLSTYPLSEINFQGFTMRTVVRGPKLGCSQVG